METACSSAMLESTYQATQYHNLKDCTSSIVNTLKQKFDLNKIQDRVKVNVPLEQATKAQKRSRGIVLPSSQIKALIKYQVDE